MSKTTNNWKNSFAAMRERFGTNSIDSLNESTQFLNLFTSNETSTTFPRKKSNTFRKNFTNSHKSFDESNQ